MFNTNAVSDAVVLPIPQSQQMLFVSEGRNARIPTEAQLSLVSTEDRELLQVSALLSQAVFRLKYKSLRGGSSLPTEERS